MAIYPKAASELNIFNDDVGDATSPPDFININRIIFFKIKAGNSYKFLQQNEY